MRDASHPRGRPGFTLIELLSVVAMIGVLASLAVPRFRLVLDQAKTAKAIGDLRTINIELQSLDSLPATLAGIRRDNFLDPWGRPYQYLPFPDSKNPPGQARKDHFLVPINSAFDLYSFGPDGGSAPALTAAVSRDDVIMANDGGYYGMAEKY